MRKHGVAQFFHELTSGSGLALYDSVDDHGSASNARLVVLLVEDKVTVRALLAELLRTEGYDVVEAPNGRRGVEVLDRQPVDVVITDARMPELSGGGLYDYIEQHHPHLRHKVIVITGHAGEDTEFFRNRKQVPILEKPFPLHVLLDVIRTRQRAG